LLFMGDSKYKDFRCEYYDKCGHKKIPELCKGNQATRETAGCYLHMRKRDLERRGREEFARGLSGDSNFGVDVRSMSLKDFSSLTDKILEDKKLD